MKRLTQETVVARFRAVHGDKYDYSLMLYEKKAKEVKIGCPIHGYFLQRPDVHWKGSGCPDCARLAQAEKIRKTTDEFIEKARKVHGDKYDYSLTDYHDAHEPVWMICHEKYENGEEHGPFPQRPNDHLNGCGCPYCAGNIKKTTEQFIEEAEKVHGKGRYDYSLSLYKSNREDVDIICHVKDENGVEHGVFHQSPDEHVNQGHGCPSCAGNIKLTKEQFIEKAEAVHGKGRYDYSLVEVDGVYKEVNIICHEKHENGEEHGIFPQKPSKHLRGQGCPICGAKKSIKARTTTLEEFIVRAREIHGYIYDYGRVEFENMNKAVMIGCPIHGYYPRTPSAHIHQKQGCPFCRQSKMEKEVTMLLDKLCVKYVEKKRFKWLGRQHLDVYLIDYNIAIECQGIQHFEPREHFGGEEEFQKTVERDKRKLQLCEKHGVPLYYIHYDEPLEEKLSEILTTIR